MNKCLKCEVEFLFLFFVVGICGSERVFEDNVVSWDLGVYLWFSGSTSATRIGSE